MQNKILELPIVGYLVTGLRTGRTVTIILSSAYISLKEKQIATGMAIDR